MKISKNSKPRNVKTSNKTATPAATSIPAVAVPVNLPIPAGIATIPAASTVPLVARETSAFARSSIGPVPVTDYRPANAPRRSTALPVLPLTARHADGAFSPAPLSTADLAAVALVAARFVVNGAASAHLDPAAFDGAIATYRVNPTCPVHAHDSTAAGRTELNVASSGPVYAGQTACLRCGMFHGLRPITNADRAIHASLLSLRALESLAGRSLNLPGDSRGVIGATLRANACLSLAVDMYPDAASRDAARFPTL